MDPQMTVKQAAVSLGVTTRTVRMWIDSGRLPAERIEGKYGPEWRITPEDVARVAERRTESPLSLDLARKPGGNDLRAIVSVLDSELQKIQSRQTEHTQQMLQMFQKLDALSVALSPPPEDAMVQGLIHQGSQLQQTVEKESRARRREAQELQASLQALSAAVLEQTEHLARLSENLAAFRARSLPWYRRLFRSS